MFGNAKKPRGEDIVVLRQTQPGACGGTDAALIIRNSHGGGTS